MTEVEALLAEREGYAQRGLAGRVAQVDAVLATYGVAVETATATPKVERAKKPAATKRKAN